MHTKQKINRSIKEQNKIRISVKSYIKVKMRRSCIVLINDVFN